jgi:putative restriction endonuclease
MAKAIFTTKISPSYKDLPELMYHFPKTYLRQTTAAIGDWILYYEPRREDSSPAGRAGRQCYFATARVTDIKKDPALKDHYYAFIENYIEFSSPVPFKIGSHYFESALRKADGSTNKGAFGRAVRNIPDEEYQAIVAAGLGKVEQEVAQMVAEENIEYDVQRPIIQQLVERPFREVIFSRIVKEEYNMTCAITGISIKNDQGKGEVEAAHIKPVKFNGPDSVRNGIALCRTFHWMFDYGLISVADNNEILVKEIVPDNVCQLINKDWRIRIPVNHNALPHPEFLKFHRKQHNFSSR